MTTLFDCLQEIIEKGPQYFIRGAVPSGATMALEWDPATLLDDMRQKSPGVLEDHAWTEWSVRPIIGSSCFIHYGVRGSSLGYQEIPGYGHLRALELAQKKQTGAGAISGNARPPLSRLQGY